MGTFRLACHLIQWGGEQHENLEKVLTEVAEAGWDGVEGVRCGSAEELVERASQARSFGLHLVNANGPDPVASVGYNATLGNDAVEAPALRRRDWGGLNPTDDDVKRAAQSLDGVLAECKRLRMKGFHHAHLGTLIETVEDAERLLAAAPNLWLLYDTGHMLAAGSDPLRVFDVGLGPRIAHVHLKDFHADDPGHWNHRQERFGTTSRFAELGQGNVGFEPKRALEALERSGYQGWVSVELDSPYPPKAPGEAARANREYLRRLGY
jgi:sugar phosphate isomerase/epimerase